MLGTCKDAQVGHLLAAQLAAGQHALDSLHDDALWMRAFQDIGFGFGLDAAWVASVPVVTLFALTTGQLDLVGIDDDHIVAHVHVRCEGRLVLAAQAHRDDRRKTTQNNAFGVNQDPFLVDIRWSCGKGFHISPRSWGGQTPQSFGLRGYIHAKRTVNRCLSDKVQTFQSLTNSVSFYPKDLQGFHSLTLVSCPGHRHKWRQAPLLDGRTLTSIAPFLFGLGLLAVATVVGVVPVRKLIQIREAKHELRHGSSGFILSVSGWAFIAFWIMGVWFAATVLGDWATHGDLAAAMDRAALRARILLEIAMALSDD